MDIKLVIFPHVKWEAIYKDGQLSLDRNAEHGYTIKAVLDTNNTPYELYKASNPKTMIMVYFNRLDNLELIETKKDNNGIISST